MSRALVERLEVRDGGFAVKADGRELAARTVLIATGLVDKEPEMANLREAIDAGAIRLCPICDGHEVIDRAVAVYGPAGRTLSHALFMRTFTDRLTLLVPHGDEPLDADSRRTAERAGIDYAESPVCEIALGDDKHAHVRLEDGSLLRFATIYPSLGCRQRSDLAIALGARANRQGEIEVDAHQRTSVPGLYAAGDVVAALNQLSVAVGHAAIAATAIHNALAA